MKYSVLTLLIMQIILAACSKQPEDRSSIPPEQMKQIVNIGKTASMTLIKTLKGELMAAIANGGPAEAISVCKDRAIYLTDSLAHNSDRVSSIKRTTLKYRNPDNAPDEVDGEVLRVYEKAVIAGDSLPQFQIREISAEGRTVFRYYQPMSIQPLCLTCHGPVENIPEKLRSALAAYYPDDRATGYNNGDFRGVVRVTINSAK